MCNHVAILAHKLKEGLAHYEACGSVLGMPTGPSTMPYPLNVTESELRATLEYVFPKGEGTIWSLDEAQQCVLLNLVPPKVHQLEMPLHKAA